MSSKVATKGVSAAVGVGAAAFGEGVFGGVAFSGVAFEGSVLESPISMIERDKTRMAPLIIHLFRALRRVCLLLR